MSFCFLNLNYNSALPGAQRGETLRDRPLAQHCAEEEEDGSSSSGAASALRLPSWSQTLLSARMAAFHERLPFLLA